MQHIVHSSSSSRHPHLALLLKDCFHVLENSRQVPAGAFLSGLVPASPPDEDKADRADCSRPGVARWCCGHTPVGREGGSRSTLEYQLSTREAGPRSLVVVAPAVQLAGEWLHRKQQLSGRRRRYNWHLLSAGHFVKAPAGGV